MKKNIWLFLLAFTLVMNLTWINIVKAKTAQPIVLTPSEDDVYDEHGCNTSLLEIWIESIQKCEAPMVKWWIKEIKTYSTSEEFLKEEWERCEVATDGCNTIYIEDWKFWATTERWCGMEKEYSCTKYKQETKEELKACTMEYAPVCAEVQVQCIKAPCYPIQKTFWNKCSAWDNNILYSWECSDLVDINQYKNYQKLTTNLKTILEKQDQETLENLYISLDELQSAVTKSRIAVFMQKKKITKYMFLKNVINNILGNKKSDF